MVLFISVTVRCSRQQLLTAVGLSQRGWGEGGRGGRERGPSSSPLLLLFCCFFASPFRCANSLARSLARLLCKDPDEEEQEGASGRRTSEKNYNKASFCLLARWFFLVAKIQTLARVFFFFFVLMERWWWWWCHFFIAWRDLCVCVCVCVFCVLLGWSDLLFSGLRFVVAGFESVRFITCLIFVELRELLQLTEESIWLISSVDYPYYQWSPPLVRCVSAYACAFFFFFFLVSSDFWSDILWGVGKQ